MTESQREYGRCAAEIQTISARMKLAADNFAAASRQATEQRDAVYAIDIAKLLKARWALDDAEGVLISEADSRESFGVGDDEDVEGDYDLLNPPAA